MAIFMDGMEMKFLLVDEFIWGKLTRVIIGLIQL